MDSSGNEQDNTVAELNPGDEPELEDGDDTANVGEDTDTEETEEFEDKQSDLDVPGGKGLVLK